jgi:cytoskeletal protein RodZ
MTVTFRQESGSDSARFAYSSDCSARLRPQHRKRRVFALEWTIWCGLAVAAVIWLALLVLALFTLSTVLPRQPAAPLTTPDLAGTVRNDSWEDPPTSERSYPAALNTVEKAVEANPDP